jgi:AhpD family alkylhydroperoxidase
MSSQIGTQQTGGEAKRSRPEIFLCYMLIKRVCAKAFKAQQGDRPMMLDWNEYHKELGARIGELAKLSPDTVRGYQTLSAANSKTGKLDEKTRQLISLAVAVTTHCDGCIVVHSDAALKAGATKEEISEALGVAVAMNAGAALVYSTRVLDAVAAKTAQAQGA